MVASAETGELVACSEGPFGLAEMQAWGEERTVRVGVLRHLLVAGQWPVEAKGVRLRGVRIGGLLDLEGAAIRCSLSLDCCYLEADEPARLDHATALRIVLTRCQLPGMTGKMLTAAELDLRRSTFTGPLTLAGAHISGQLICSGAQLTGADGDGYALAASAIKASDVFLDSGFAAAGAVLLWGAEITGQLVCGGAKVTGRDSDGNALVADRMKTSDVFLDHGFTADGAVRLSGADIAGQLTCGGAQLKSDNRGRAVFADGMKTGGHAFLNEGFTANGAIRLQGAEITGLLSLNSAQLTGTEDGNALIADAMKGGSDVLLRDGFTAAGRSGWPARTSPASSCAAALS